MKNYTIALKIMKSKKPDSKLALVHLREAHDEGDYRATYAIATWYLHGDKSLRKNIKKAIEYLQIAADNNIASAQYDLAVSYEMPNGLKKNRKKAFELYLRAALNGHVKSAFEVGRCYNYGIGIKQNKKLAILFYDNALSRGYVERNLD